MVEYGILILNECDTKYVKDAIWTGKRLTTNLVLDKSFNQVVASLRVFQVLNSPGQVNKLLFWRQEEVQ